MKKDPQQIAQQIIDLVSELAALAGAPQSPTAAVAAKKVPAKAEKDTSGATGGIRLLLNEEKLNTPKELPEILELLQQEGRHYSSQSVSMGLLNLVRKERVLTRLREKGAKNKKWKYVIRK